MLIILALGKLRLEDHLEFRTSLNYIMSELQDSTLQSKTLSFKGGLGEECIRSEAMVQAFLLRGGLVMSSSGAQLATYFYYSDGDFLGNQSIISPPFKYSATT